MRRLILGTSVLAALAAFNSSFAADWRQFRGNAANSVAVGESLPTELSGATIAWKTPLPGRGLSGPIIVGDKVFVSSSSGYGQDRLHVVCVNADSGEQIWQRQFDATGRTMTHDKMCNATPTMASDGERVYAFYSSNDLISICRGNCSGFEVSAANFRMPAIVLACPLLLS